MPKYNYLLINIFSIIIVIFCIVFFTIYSHYFYNLFIYLFENNNVNDKKLDIQVGSKSALVTGGARGIGEAYVRLLLDNGYNVAIVDILDADKKANELRKLYPNQTILGLYCDVMDNNSYLNAFNTASNMSRDGILDLVVLNAGIIDVLFGNSENIIKTNLLAPMYGTEIYIKQITNSLKEPSKKECLIVITCSLASYTAIDLNLSPVYDASKGGLEKFIRACKPIAKRFNFRINGICPTTIVNTGLTQKYIENNKEVLKMFLNTEGRGDIMEPSDVSPALLHIINTQHLNGDLISVNKSLGITARIEPRDEFGSFDEYGIWSEDKSLITRYAIDYQLNDIITNNQNIWSKQVYDN